MPIETVLLDVDVVYKVSNVVDPSKNLISALRVPPANEFIRHSITKILLGEDPTVVVKIPKPVPLVVVSLSQTLMVAPSEEFGKLKLNAFVACPNSTNPFDEAL